MLYYAVPRLVVIKIIHVPLLQEELEGLTTYSKKCESERDGLREEKKAWEKTEANLRDDVKKLQETCSKMEESRITLDSNLKDAEVRNCIYNIYAEHHACH